MPDESLTVPAAKVTKYLVLLAKSLVGSMVRVLPVKVRRVLVATLKVSMVVPVADTDLIRILPVPLTTASLKVSTMLLPTATPVAASVGLNVETVGAVVSAAAAVVKSYTVVPV